MPATGRCLCGAVRYEIDGPLRDILLCHCEECRRWHGHVCAMTAARNEDFRLLDDAQLRWIDSPASATHARRGFCGACGSSLFWQAAGSEKINIAAGSLDPPTGLRVFAQVYTADAGDYYDLDAALESFEQGADASTSAVPRASS